MNTLVAVEDYADASATLYNVYIGPTKRVDDKVIYIGHSAGASSASGPFLFLVNSI